MFGFGPKMSQVFASRWKALTWSLGILATAYCTLPAADVAREHETKQVVQATAAHKSPWAKD